MHLTPTIYSGVIADGETVTAAELTDLSGVGIDAVIPPVSFERGEAYTVTVTPIWEDMDGSYRDGATRMTVICLPVSE